MKDNNPTQNATEVNDGIRDTTGMLKNLSADMARLVLVEARLFGHTLLAMLGLTLVIALLLVSSWLFIGAALVVALASLQAFSLTGALLTVALLHLLLAALAMWRLRYITRDLTFRQSRASIHRLFNHAASQSNAQADATERQPEEK